MEHLHKDLGELAEGSTVVVALSNEAHVHLMTRFEYENYKHGRRYQFYGRRVTESPFRIVVPRDGDWVVAIDLGGRPGRIDARIGVNPPPPGYVPGRRPSRLAALERIELRTPVEPPAGVLGGQTWDVLVAHAAADRARVARPLREALVATGVSAWLEEVTGDPARPFTKRLDEQLPAGRLAVVVVSASFFGCGFEQHELDDLARTGASGLQAVLVLRHEVAEQQVRARSELLAGAVSVGTGERSTEELAALLADLVKVGGTP